DAHLPGIDWTLPAIPSFDDCWVVIRYPEFSAPSQVPGPRVIGTSGAWKDVLGKLEGFPALHSASEPRDLQQRVSTCEAAKVDILGRASAAADDMARRKHADLEQQVLRLQEAEKVLEGRVRPQLEKLECAIEAMCSGSFLDRLKADRLRSRLSQYEIRLNKLWKEARER